MIGMPVMYPDFSTYEENISADGNINFVDREKLEDTLAQFEAKKDTCDTLMNAQLCYMGGGFNREGKSGTSVRKIFVEHGVPESIFKKHTTKSGLSFDKEAREKLVNWLSSVPYENDTYLNILNYMSMYEDRNFYEATISSMEQNRKRSLLVHSDAKGYNNKQLLEMFNVYEQRITGRYYANSVPLVQLPLPVRQCITVPDGYFILALDLDQIDIRVSYNMYLRGYYPEDDRIFDAEKDDKYKAMYIIACTKTKTMIDLHYFEENRSEIKTAILAAMYGAQHEKLMHQIDSEDVVAAISGYFANHKGYQNLIAKIERLYNLSVSFVVKDYFGFEIQIDLYEDEELHRNSGVDNRYSIDQVIRWVISRTVQSTSNSIIVNWTNTTIEQLRSEGKSEEHIWVMMQRHDEIDFAIHRSIIDSLDTIFDSMKIKISDWDDITFGASAYLYYESEPDEDGENFDGEKALLTSIRTKINEYLNKSYPILPKSERIPNKCVPNVHEVYAVTFDSIETLYKGLLGEPTSPNEEECIRVIEEKATKGILPEIYKHLRKAKDMYILKNSITQQTRLFEGLDVFEQFLIQFDIQYLNAKVLCGSNTKVVGPALLVQSAFYSVESEFQLKDALEGKIKRGV